MCSSMWRRRRSSHRLRLSRTRERYVFASIRALLVARHARRCITTVDLLMLLLLVLLVYSMVNAGRQVWTIAPCPSDPGLVITGAQSGAWVCACWACGEGGGDDAISRRRTVVDGKIERRTTLWRMPGIADVAGGGGGDGSASMPVGAAPEVSAHARGELRELVVFPAVSLERRLIRVLWDPHGRPGAAVENLLTVDDQNVRLWTLGGAALQVRGAPNRRRRSQAYTLSAAPRRHRPQAA